MSDANYSGNGSNQVMLMGIVYLMLYRLSIIATGALSIYLGYRLFLSGLFPYAVEGSSFNAEILGNTFSLQNAAPGIFFALFGVIVIVIMIVRSPPEVGITTSGKKVDAETGEVTEFQARGFVETAEVDDELMPIDDED
ncbi:MAG: hypothetical protein AB8G95_01910 [Anaerolineae bacterium]